MKCLSGRVTLFALLLLGGGPLLAQPGGMSETRSEHETRIPPTSAVLEVIAPADARVGIDGKDHGPRRRFVIGPLVSGQRYEYDVSVTFGGGGKAERRRVTMRAGQLVRLAMRPPTTLLPEMVMQTGHTSTPQTAVFSPDGRYLLTVGFDSLAILWDAGTGRNLRSYRHEEELISADFSPDGRTFVTGTLNGTVTVWEVETGRRLARRERICDGLNRVAYSPDGESLVVSGGNGVKPARIRGLAAVWDASLTTKGREFTMARSSIRAVRFSPDGKFVLTGDEANTDGKTEVVLWDRTDGRVVWSYSVPTGADVYEAVFSLDGRQILFGTRDGLAILLDARRGREVRRLASHNGGSTVRGVALSPDGTQALTCSTQFGNIPGEVILWDVATGKVLQRKAAGREEKNAVRPASAGAGRNASFVAVAFSPDGRTGVVTRQDGRAFLWDLRSGDLLHRLEGKADLVHSVAVRPDGAAALTAAAGHAACLWNLAAGLPRTVLEVDKRTRYFPDGNYVTEVSFGPDGRQMVTASFNRETAVWDGESGRKLDIKPPNDWGYVYSARLSPTGDRLLMGSYTESFLWDVKDGKPLWSHRGPSMYLKVFSVAFRPDGREVLIGYGGAYGGVAIPLNATTGREIGKVLEHKSSVHSVTYSPDGKYVLTASGDQTAVVWDANTWKRVRTLTGPACAARVAQYTPDGQGIVNGFADGTVILWDAATGRKQRTLTGHAGGVNSVSFTPDGRRMLTAGDDGTTRLWDLATGDELARLLSLDGGRHWAVVTPEGLFDGSLEGRGQVCFRVGDRLDVVPLDRFFQDFYYPGLLSDLWRGERPLPGKPLTSDPAPLVKMLVNPEPGQTGRVAVDVAVTDQGGGIKGPWIKHNGVSLNTGRLLGQDGKTSTYRFPLALVSGDNRIEARAATFDGVREGEPAFATVPFDGRPTKPDLYLISVGIDRYADNSGVANLEYCTADARAITDLFRRGKGQLYEKVHVTQLLDEQATREGILRAVAACAAKAKAQDTLVLYVASHGFAVGQRFYLIPQDFRLDTAKPPASEKTVAGLRGYRGDDGTDAAVRVRGLAIDELGEQLARVPALKRVLIFDTCHSGGAVQLADKRRNPFAFRGAIERFGRAQGVYCLAASAADELAAEERELGHSILTFALLASAGAVEGGPPADKPVGSAGEVLDVLGWFRAVRVRVPQLYQKYYGRAQHVELAGDDQPTFSLLSTRGP